MSNNFLENLKVTINEEYNTSITENGAVGYKTSGKELIDINFAVTSLRSASEGDIEDRFFRAYMENPLLAIKWLFYAADVREGSGERRLFRICMHWLALEHKDQAKAVLSLVPEYTRWDNILCLLETDLKNDVIDLIREQLNEDMIKMKAGEPISLCAKWLPSNNASSVETRTYAKIITKNLELSDREYRKMLSKLRAYLNIVETHMSKKEYDKIDYSKVPSRANLLYNGAFLRNDEDRRRAFLDALTKGETKINAGVLFPHDIVNKYNETGWYGSIKETDTTLEELWKALPDFVNGAGNTLCITDGSGSMGTRVSNKSNVSAMDVARALTFYFSERSSGEFKDKYITFSERPQLVDLSNAKTLREKILLAEQHTECENTNIEAAFDLILSTAIRTGMKQEDFPKNLLILSDMEFDGCVVSNEEIKDFDRWYPITKYKKADKALFKTIAEKYENAGYKLPRLVFWNICSRTMTIPVRENEMGVALVSGFSPSTAKMVLSNKLDPFECLLEQLNAERYDAVEEAVKPVL